MQTFETAAVISLIDHLSGPLNRLASNVAGHQSKFTQTINTMSSAGQRMTLGVTLPLVEAGKHLIQHAAEYSKIENTMHGILLNRARTVKDLTGSYEDYAEAQKKAIQSGLEGALSNPDHKGMINALEYQKSAMAAVKAGLDTEAAVAIAGQGAQLDIAGRITQDEAAEALITLGNAFGVVTKNADGTAKSLSEVEAQYRKIGDMVATMSTNANMSTKDAVEALKLPAPLWHLNKQDPGVLGAMVEAMAEKGFKGSEAGVALRAFVMAASAPKSTAFPMFANAGLDMSKMQERMHALTPEEFVKFERNRGLKVALADAKKAFAEANGEDGLDMLKLHVGLSDAIKRSGKKANPITANQALKEIAAYSSQSVMSTNLLDMILKMREMNEGRGPTPSQLKQFGEGRQAPRWTSFLTPAGPGAFDPFDFAMKRMYGDDWRSEFDKAMKDGHGHMDPKFLGNMQRMAQEHMQGLEGAIMSMKNAFEELNMALYKSGAYEGIANGLHTLADTLRDFSKANPETLKAVAKGLTMLAAVGPMLWFASTAMNVARGLTALAGAVGAGSAVTAIQSVATALGGLATAAAAVPAAVIAATAALAAGKDLPEKLVKGRQEMAELQKKMTVLGSLIDGGRGTEDTVRNRAEAERRYNVLKREQEILLNGGSIDRYDRVTQPYQPRFIGGQYGGAVAPGSIGRGMFPLDASGGYNFNTGPQPMGAGWEVIGAAIARGFHNLRTGNLTGPEQQGPNLPDSFAERIASVLKQAKGEGEGAIVESVHQVAAEVSKVNSQPVKVSGEVQGQAELKQTITIVESPLFNAKMDRMNSLVMHLNGEVSSMGSKLGQTMSGSNAAKSGSPAPAMDLTK